jgi:secondary thiamine-phosphate synthase enzyme
MQTTLNVKTTKREELVDITNQVTIAVEKSNVKTGLISVFAQGATSAIMVQENWDDSVQTDVINFLNKIIPRGIWLHDKSDENGDSHLKAGLIGPSETIPIIDGKLGLSRWQNIFLCEFDGPRQERFVLCTIFQTP